MGCNGMPFFSSNFLINQTEEDDHQPPTILNPLFPPCSPQDFHGIASLLGKRTMSFSGTDHICEDVITNGGDEDLSDDGLYHGGEKKRRLNLEQLKTLEKTFEQGNKLEPERKLKLAKALGLQPRQIAIWFQNRRARSKTKQLEKDYAILKRHFDAVKAENDSLIAHNQNLHAQLLSLRSYKDHPESINLNKETIIDQNSCSTRSDNSSEIQLDISRTPPIDSPVQHAHVPISIPLFPTSSSTHHTPTTTGTQLFFSPSSRPDHPHHHELMMSTGFRSSDQHNTNCNNINEHAKDENFSNMFCGIDDGRSGSLWPWLEEQEHFD